MYSLNLSLVALALFVFTNPAGASLTLRSGFTSVSVSATKSWSVERLEIRGFPVMEAPSGNGAVIQFSDGTWSGEGHGSESLESVSLTVDGVSAAVQDGVEYRGTILVLSRVLLLDGSIRMNHVLTISPDGVDQVFSLAGLSPGRGILRAYVGTETRSNLLTQATVREGERTLATWSTDRDDWSFFRSADISSADTVLQADPEAGYGILTRWIADPLLEVAAWVWDRPIDNKLYLVATGYTDAGTNMTLQQSIRFCRAADCGF